jgi:hypothetical protein
VKVRHPTSAAHHDELVVARTRQDVVAAQAATDALGLRRERGAAALARAADD